MTRRTSHLVTRLLLLGMMLLVAIAWADHAAGATDAAAGAAASAAGISATTTPSQDTQSQEPLGSSADPSGTGADEGRTVFLRDCAWCHGTSGSGTELGPSLLEGGAAAADFYLTTGRMPLEHPGQRVQAGDPAYPEDTIESLVQYVGSLSATGMEVPAVGPGDPASGRTLFLANCAACHSSSGTGMIVSGGEWAPELFDTPSTQVAEAVRLGPGPMPRFTERQLDQREMNDVVAYVQQLGPSQVKGGASLDQFGPIIEGMMALFVLVPSVAIVARLLGKRAPK